jgi:hypothetical protein
MVEIIAVIASMAAILSMRVERYQVHKREERRSRLRAFKTLTVGEEAVPSAPQRLGILDSRDGELDPGDGQNPRVRNAWKEYLDQLACYPRENSGEDEQKKWKEKTDELLLEILLGMAEALHYDFGKIHAQKAGYVPDGSRRSDGGLDFIRSSLVRLFVGNLSVPIEIRATAKGGEKVSSEKTLCRLLIEHFEENKPLRVIMESDRKPG